MRVVASAVLTGLLLVLAGAPVQAQSADDVRARFAAADTDHDGRLTLAEARRGMPRIAANFDKIDSRHKGYLTLDEVLAVANRN